MYQQTAQTTDETKQQQTTAQQQSAMLITAKQIDAFVLESMQMDADPLGTLSYDVSTFIVSPSITLSDQSLPSLFVSMCPVVPCLSKRHPYSSSFAPQSLQWQSKFTQKRELAQSL